MGSLLEQLKGGRTSKPKGRSSKSSSKRGSKSKIRHRAKSSRLPGRRP